jgi:hypothetical protein
MFVTQILGGVQADLGAMIRPPGLDELMLGVPV